MQSPPSPGLLKKFKKLLQKAILYRKGNINPQNAQTDFKDREIIFNEDEKANFGYQIITGSVDIYVDYALPDEKYIATLIPGKFLGEMGALENLPRNATAIAKGKVKLQVFNRNEIISFVASANDGELQLLKHESENLKNITRKYLQCLDVLDDFCAESILDPTIVEKIKKNKHDHDVFMSHPNLFA